MGFAIMPSISYNNKYCKEKEKKVFIICLTYLLNLCHTYTGYLNVYSSLRIQIQGIIYLGPHDFENYIILFMPAF